MASTATQPEALASDFSRIWAKILAQSWSDPTFREQVASDVEGVLAKAGVSFPAGMSVSIGPVAATQASTVLVLPFPDKPAELEMLSPDEQPKGVAADATGACSSCSLTCCCCCP